MLWGDIDIWNLNKGVSFQKEFMYFSWSGGPKPLAAHNSCFADAPAGQASLALQTTQVVVMITMMVIMMVMGMMMMMMMVVTSLAVVVTAAGLLLFHDWTRQYSKLLLELKKR